MLKRYQRPNKAPSSRVLSKPLEEAAALSPALSGTEAALASKRPASGSEGGAREEVRGRNLKAEDEESSAQDRRVKEEDAPLEVTLPLPSDLEGRAEGRKGWKRSEWERGAWGRGLLLRRGREGPERVKATLCIISLFEI